MFCDFETTSFGKWILAGEHAVVRGHGALVFPIKAKYLTLAYRATPSSLGADYTGSSGADMHLLFWSVLEQGMKLLYHSLNQLQGQFHLDCNIPVGVGLGASAALCVAMSRWFHAQGLIDESSINEFSRELEHLFHGKSSGLDIAGASSDSGIFFQQGQVYPLATRINPIWCLSSCNQIGITAHCISQVQQLWQTNPTRALSLDEQMIEATTECRMILEQGGVDAIGRLANSMNKASDCFHQWGLVSEGLAQHMSQLLSAGALAVKPTGSGGGGYVLSLWDKAPSKALELIRV